MTTCNIHYYHNLDHNCFEKNKNMIEKGCRHHIMKNYERTKRRIGQVLQTRDEFGRVTCEEGISTHNACLKTVALIKLIKSNVVY